MKNLTRSVGILEMVERLPNSKNGNPRYKCRCGSVDFITGIDSSHGYSISNDFGKKAIVTVGTHYGKTTLDRYQLQERVL